jgi:hypothetical protein
MTELDDLGARLRDLAPAMPPPPDLMATLRPTVRRHRAARAGRWGLAATALVAGVLTVPGYVSSHAPLPGSVVARYASADAPPVRYTGPDVPIWLRDVPSWVVALRQAGTERLAIVTYEQDGHPCLGTINDGSEGDCSLGDLIDLRWAYHPFGAEHLTGPDAVLFGAVPANVRIVAAHVHDGRLAQRYVSTVGSPVTARERFFVFDSPGGATRPLRAELIFYDANGHRVGSRHVDADAVVRDGP